jgi:hypothetical protein
LLHRSTAPAPLRADEQHRAVVDASPGVRLEAHRVGKATVDGIPPTTKPPVGSTQTADGSNGEPPSAGGDALLRMFFIVFGAVRSVNSP